MSMESLGGRMPVGRPAAVFAGGKTHVFAIAVGGGMNHWSSSDGLSWTGPTELLRGPVNLEPSYACAIAAGSGVHVLAVNHNANPFARGGAIAHWFSPDGVTFLPPILEQSWEIPGSGNGIAAAAPGGTAAEAFAVSGFNQLVRYSWSSGYASTGAAPLPGPPLPASAPAAAAAGGGVTEAFAVAADGNALRWRIVNGVPAAPSVLPRPPGAPAGPLFHGGLTAVSPAPGQVEVFAVTAAGLLVNWSIDGLSVSVANRSGPMPLHDSVPVALMVGDHLEVFAIGRPPNPFAGGPLIRWRRDRASGWSRAVTIGANLAAGGLGAAAGVNRVDAFGFNSGTDNSLLHWPAGIAAAQRDGWANWGNNRQTPSPAGHCRPSTHEDVVAIVRSAERVPGARVRAVGSSWSFSDIAMTPSFIVETREIAGVSTHVIDASVLTEQAPAAKYLLHVGAGTVVEDLMLTLDALGLAPFTLGGASGQTIAGVVSTSVHGSDIDRGPIPHAVRALQLVGPGGVQHWIEPDAWRITKRGPLRARLGPDVQIRYDDDWFDAALVSMGSMGVITSLVYEATDQYKLEKTCEEMRWSVLKQRLLDGTDFVGEHHSVMVAIDPVELGDRTCFVTKRRDMPMSAPTTPPSGPPDPLGAFCQMNAEQALQQMGALIGIGVVIDVAVTTAQALGIPIPVIPPGVSTAVTISIIVAALKLGGPGRRRRLRRQPLQPQLGGDRRAGDVADARHAEARADVRRRRAPDHGAAEPGRVRGARAGDRGGVRRLHRRSHRVPRRGDGDARHEAPGRARPGLGARRLHRAALHGPVAGDPVSAAVGAHVHGRDHRPALAHQHRAAARRAGEAGHQARRDPALGDVRAREPERRRPRARLPAARHLAARAARDHRQRGDPDVRERLHRARRAGRAAGRRAARLAAGMALVQQVHGHGLRRQRAGTMPGRRHPRPQRERQLRLLAQRSVDAGSARVALVQQVHGDDVLRPRRPSAARARRVAPTTSARAGTTRWSRTARRAGARAASASRSRSGAPAQCPAGGAPRVRQRLPAPAPSGAPTVGAPATTGSPASRRTRPGSPAGSGATAARA